MSKEKKIADIVEQSLLLARMIADQSTDNPKMTESILGNAATRSAKHIQQQLNQLDHEN
jgi:hypothetical protein